MDILKYLVTINGNGNKVELMLTYQVRQLWKAEIISTENEMTMDQIHWIWQWLPHNPTILGHKMTTEKFTMKEVKEDLTFNAFWDAYAYKVGNKSRAKKLWESLDEGDRAKCLAVIPKYRFWLGTKNNMEQMYPEGFLSQRRWENEYKIK